MVESDRAVIDEIRRRLEASENANDAAATGELLADDAVLMVPDFPVQEGKAACIAFMDGVLDWVLERFDRRIAYVSTEVAFAGDAAFDRGTFAFTVTPKSGGPGSRVTGKYLWLLGRDAGARWKISRIIISRDDAPEPETPLQPEQQRFIEAHPATFTPEAGAWGRQGCTAVRLESADEDTLGEAITLAWQNVTSTERRSRRRATGGTGGTAA